VLPTRQIIRDKYTRHLEYLADHNHGEVFDLSAADLRDLQTVLLGMDLSSAKLVGIFGPGIVLEAMNFAGADLQRVYFKDGHLAGSNFEGANLEGAYLCGANLRRCSFKNANLRRVDFGGADMLEVDLEGADLEEAFVNYVGLNTGIYVPDGKGLLHMKAAS
jgi:uncharacterized protein YjbI with pentapeptide repeats